MKLKYKVFSFILVMLLLSCGNDDNGLPEGEVVPPRLLSEVAQEDDATLREYLETHFYNYEEFETPPDNFDFKVRIDTIAGANVDKRPLLEDIQSQVISVSPSSFGLSDQEEDVPVTLYFLEANEGSGNFPTIGDNSILSYEGSLLNGDLFDASTVPIKFYLPGLVRGFGIGMTKFKTGDQIVENGDGTLDFGNFGVGILFIPSGLGYFNGRGPSGDIPQYSNLIFKVGSFAFEENTDFDGDGIPSILEDLNGDGNLNNDNTDGDFDPFSGPIYNHLDTDDDNDGIPTREEVELDGEGNFVGFLDTDGDGVEDHLDNDN